MDEKVSSSEIQGREMDKVYRIGHTYKDILSVSRNQDEFVSWFAMNGSGIGNSGGIRCAKFLNLSSCLPCYIVLITRNTSHRWYNPWEDVVDYSSGTIFYWGDAKLDNQKSHGDFRGNKRLVNVFTKVLENQLSEIPPILHFSKIKRGVVKFNGLCVLKNLELTWFEDKGIPVKNYRAELSILDIEEVHLEWLLDRVNCSYPEKLHLKAPKVWKDYLKGNIKKLDVWSKSVLDKSDQLPPEGSAEDYLLKRLCKLSPTEFEAVVVDLFRRLPHVSHKIVRTKPTADGGFDFFGKFSIPHPVRYEISFLGEAKKFSRDSAVQPKHVSRLVARLNRGQFGIFVTTSYYTKQTQREVIEDGFPVRLFSGNDVLKILKELKLTENGNIKEEWLESVKEAM